MSKFLKKEWTFLLILVIPFIIAITVFPHLPDKVPTHWNVHGQVDNYSSREFGAFFMPFFNIFLYIMLLVTPYIDPKKMNYEKFKSSYNLIRYVIHIFMFMLYILIILAALGYSVDIGLWVAVGVCILFILLGNVMGRIRHNYFVGIKMPWTLASEEVWRKTHLLASKLIFAGGSIGLIGVVFTQGTLRFIVLMLAIFVPIMISTIYSYWYFRRVSNQ